MTVKNPISRARAEKIWRRQLKTKEWRDFKSKFLRHFRPRQSEYDSIVFLAWKRGSKKPERLPAGSRRKGIPLYITKAGKIEPVFEHKRRFSPRAMQHIAPRYFDSRGVVAGVEKRRAIVKAERKYRAEYLPASPLPAARPRPRKRAAYWDELQSIRAKPGKNVDWARAAQRISDAMRTALTGELRREKQLFVHLQVRGVAANGREFVWDDRIFFAMSQLQDALHGNYFRPFIMKKCFAFFADLLAQAGYVTRGSREFVAKLPWNRNRPVSQWLDSRQMAWEKRDVADDRVVDIQEIRFQLERVKFVV